MRFTHQAGLGRRFGRPGLARAAGGAAAAVALLAGLLGFARGAGGATIVPSLEYSQDGAHYTPVRLITGTETGAAYYGYRRASGHPAFGTVRGEATTGLYWDDTHDQLSLMFLAGSTQGTASHPENGKASVQFSGLPVSARLTVQDDKNKIKYKNSRSKASATFTYYNHTEGLEFSGLELTPGFVVKMLLKPASGVTGWRLTDGAPNAGGDFLPLDFTKPLYLREVPANGPGSTGGTTGGVGGTPGGTTGAPGTPGTTGTSGPGTGVTSGGTAPGGAVPEPASLAVLSLAAAGLAARPCRRRGRGK